MIVVAAALLFGGTSCVKEKGETGPQGEGAVSIKFDFGAEPEGRAATSTAKPKTSWSRNIKDLTLVLTETTGNEKVKVVRELKAEDLPKADDTTAFKQVFSNVTTGTYNVYVVANIRQTKNPHVTDETADSQPITVGKDFKGAAAFLYNLKAATIKPTVPVSPGEPANYMTHSEPAEVFIAKSAAPVSISEGTTATTTVDLKRAVSLFRIRLNVTSKHADPNFIDFNKGNIRLRRINSYLNYSSGAGVALGSPKVGVLYSHKPFKKAADVGTDYEGDMGLGTDYTLWNDYIVLPGGSTTVATGYNLMITAFAKEGYDAGDAIVPAGGSIVAWQGTLDKVTVANGILVANVTFLNPGVIISGKPDIPPPAQLGKLDVTVKLHKWGPVVNTEVPM